MRTHTFTTSAPTWPLHAVIMDDDFSGDFEGYDEDESELDDFDCGLTDDGTCMNAGSEWCDFECPMRDTDAYAGNVK